MNKFRFLYHPMTGELGEGRIGHHDDIPPEWEFFETDFHEIPRWFPRHAIFEAGQLREMTEQEKAAADAQRETEQKTQEFNANRALHAALKVFLGEFNSLRQAGGLNPLDANEVKNRIEQEYITI